MVEISAPVMYKNVMDSKEFHKGFIKYFLNMTYSRKRQDKSLVSIEQTSEKG